jgi:hypothetical protein
MAISCARPSTMAVLPTPASPISTGLFFVRRQRIWMTRRISFLRPMTGSISPLRASSVRSRPKALRAGVLTSFFIGRPRRARSTGAASSPGAALASGPPSPPPTAGNCGSSSRRISLRRALDVDIERLQHAGGDALALAQQAEQDVLGADVGMIERLGLLAGERQNLLHARRVRECSPAVLVS